MRLHECCFSVIILCLYWQESAAEGNSTNVTRLELVKLRKLTPRNSTGRKKSKIENLGRKREIENGTFNPFESLLLLPILPFLFPPIEEGFLPLDEPQGLKNDTGDKERGKPFVFFDFAFNVREIPPKNASERGNDSKIINVKKLTEGKDRQKRNKKRGDFFEETFPDAELDEFLPKPDLFFPDLSFHPKPVKKLRRKKREPEVGSEFKSFLDAFDEAFMRTKEELERTDPILNLIKGMESSFGDEKNEEENPKVKWKVERDVKSGENEESPMIVMDKVVKIGEFRLHGDKRDKRDKHEGKKGKRKRKREVDKRKFLGDVSTNDANVTSIHDVFKQYDAKNGKKHKKNHHGREQIPPTGSNSIRDFPLRGNSTGVTKIITEETSNVENSIEEKKEKRKKASYEDLKKNITQILNEFLGLDNKAEGESGGEERDEDYAGDLGLFDWTEKEILEAKTRHKKEFPMEYADTKKEERKIANSLANVMKITLPTIFVIVLVLLACIWALQPKGVLCAMLFRPRKVYTVAEDEEQQITHKKPKPKKVVHQPTRPQEGVIEVHEQ